MKYTQLVCKIYTYMGIVEKLDENFLNRAWSFHLSTELKYQY